LNTSFNDLKNQLKFLGIDDLQDLFRAFEQHFRGTRRTDEPLLLFFLRSIMMRHTQNQKYRGTSTTLMALPEKVSHNLFVVREASYRSRTYIVDSPLFLDGTKS
jgi:hypothetical protein